MSARALLANPALFAGYEACPWEAVELFMNKVVKAPLPFKLVQHHRKFALFSALGETQTNAILTQAGLSSG
jgi:tRNA-dihydrouridine synthase 4